MSPNLAVAVSIDRTMLDACMENLASYDQIGRENTPYPEPVIKKLRIIFGGDFLPDFDAVLARRERLTANNAYWTELYAHLPVLIADAAALLGPDALPDDQVIHLVCGTPSDGYGYPIDGKIPLFIDMGNIPTDFLPSLMRHEMWHVGFRTLYPEQSRAFSIESSAEKYLAFQLLNEGVGHYYSFQRRLEPTIQYDDWPERTEAVFALLQEQYETLLTLESPEDIERHLWRSHVGVPFWKKWGAVPGAIMTYRMRKALGDDKLRRIISRGPCAFVSEYEELRAQYPDWESPPKGLISAACDGPQANNIP